jgi:ATP-binding cassette subfamily F protein uup
MDRLVEHLFVFEGEGKIRDFPGNYTDFREWEKENQQEDHGPKTEAPKVERQESRSEKQESAPKVKASFKQKQEFKKVTETMAKLEGEKSTITDQIAAGTSDVNQLITWTNRLQSIDRELEELELAWLDLSELEGIE